MNSTDTAAKPNVVEQFQREFSHCWRALPDKGLFLGLLAAWLVLFHFLGNSTLGYIKTHSLFEWLWLVYDASPDDAHGLYIPFVVLGLLWWKRKILLATSKTVWWPALGLVVLGLGLHFIGFVIQQPRISIVGFFAGLYGLTGLVWGRAWLRASFFPFFIFVFCVPLATTLEPLTFHLRLLVAKVVTVIGHILGIDVIRDGTQLFNAARTFAYDVAPACSGIRSVISLLALTTIYGFVVFRTTWKRLFMAGLAVPLAILGNVIRVSLVIVTAEMFDHNAGAWVEQKLGFITFAVAIGCIILLGRWWYEPGEAAAGAAEKIS